MKQQKITTKKEKSKQNVSLQFVSTVFFVQKKDTEKTRKSKYPSDFLDLERVTSFWLLKSAFFFEGVFFEGIKKYELFLVFFSKYPSFKKKEILFFLTMYEKLNKENKKTRINLVRENTKKTGKSFRSIGLSFEKNSLSIF